LIENYLDITAIEAGTLSLVKELSLCMIWSATPRIILKMGPDRRIDNRVSREFALVKGDGERLKRVLINVLENALRYGPQRETVVISAREDTDSVVISVVDKGPGIKKEDQGKIFDKFFRGADAITERTKGSGLGLAIAKGIVKPTEGPCGSSPSLARGRRSVSASLKTADISSEECFHFESGVMIMGGHSILIIDDDPNIVELLSVNLLASGYEC